MPYAFIFNPSANRKRAQASYSWLQKRVSLYWPDAKIYITDSKADIGRAVREASQKHDVIIACGGDGTVNEVFSQAIDMDVTLGVLPMGSGNDFAKSIHFSTNPVYAIDQLRDVMPEYVDAIQYVTNNGAGYMFNTMGIGLDGAINFEASKVTFLRGALIYIYAALRSVFRVEPSQVRLSIDEHVSEEKLIMFTIANGKIEGGNFKVAPDADNCDGVLDLVSVPPLPVYRLILLLPLFLLGRQRISSRITFRRGREIKLKLETPLPLHVDGEQVGLRISSLRAVVLPSKVRVLKPSDLN